MDVALKHGEVAIIDERDSALVIHRQWRVFRGYARCGRDLMHRVIMNAPKGLEVDHINGNKLDNRRDNLRLCTKSENQRNQHTSRGKSRFKGVYSKVGKWQASLTCNSKTVYIGLFSTEEAAARAYDRAALEHFGEFARLNFPEETEKGMVAFPARRPDQP